jgi:Amt family ammonium transporter
VFGTLCVGLFADPTVCPAAAAVKAGLFMGGGTAQLVPQIIGIVAVGAFVFIAASATWFLLKATIGIRVSAAEETEGLDYGEHGNVAYPDFHPSAEA